MSQKYCPDCGLPVIYHFRNWFDGLIDICLPHFKFPKKVDSFFSDLIEKIFLILGLIKIKDDFEISEIEMRSGCFINEAKKYGIKFKALKSSFGYTNYFWAEINGKRIRFEGLPLAEYKSKYNSTFIDNKIKVKAHLKKEGFPIAEGKSFWFYQKKQALKFGNEKLGYPLVVKPFNGSVARHVTINIRNEKELQEAIKKTIVFSPLFLIERFIENSFVYRATVVDFNFVAVVRQVPANIVGDGFSTIQQLIKKKNSDSKRGESYQNNFIFHKIIINETTVELLKAKDYDLNSVPKKDEIVYLQERPFLRLGGDLAEVTGKVHPDNIELFKKIARFFDVRLVGIDFIIPNIEVSYKNQVCAVLDLNSLPCIEMHQFPSSGEPQNVGKAIVESFLKYYL